MSKNHYTVTLKARAQGKTFSQCKALLNSEWAIKNNIIKQCMKPVFKDGLCKQHYKIDLS